MATRGNLKSVEFKQAALATAPATLITQAPVAPPNVGQAISAPVPDANPSAVMKPAGAMRPLATTTTKSPASAPSPVAAVAAKGAPISPRFTAEETILLRGLASGSSSKEMAAQMRLPRESLYRLIGDLRRKTGANSDTALAVWVLRNMSSGAGERRGGAR
jgi:DNA-binding CsgD family transcriptional regulator